MDLVVTYKIKPDSANVVVTDILGIRPAAYNADGSYSLPEGLTDGNGTIRQLGLSPREDRALIYIQPPPCIWLPNSGHGPITRKIIVKKRFEQLAGDYDRFPSLPRTRTTYELELTEGGMPYVRKETYETLIRHSPADQECLAILLENNEFSAAVENVFAEAGFSVALANVISLSR